MALLRNLEHSLSGLLEGTVGRVFRTEVRPTEIARKLAREMEINKRVSLSRTYAPTDYLVYLSPEDRARYAGVEDSIADELGAYLLEHARRERLVLVRRPLVVFRTDQRLRLGEFGIEARTAPISADEAPPRPQRTAAQVGADPAREQAAVANPAAPRRAPQPAEPVPNEPQAFQPQAQPEPQPQPELAPEPEYDEAYEDPYAGDPFTSDPAVEPEPVAPPYDDHAAEEHAPDWLDPIEPWEHADRNEAAGVPWIDPQLRPSPNVPRTPPVEVPPVQHQVPPVQPPAPAPPQQPTLVLAIDGARHEFYGDYVVLGRSRSCNVTVADPSVSRRHAELRCDEYGWYVADLGSTNGTLLDGAVLTQPTRLTSGQRLMLGHAPAVIEVH